MRKLFLKIKRFIFKRSFGFNPEDIRRMHYLQMYLDKRSREADKRYNSYLRDNFNAK